MQTLPANMSWRTGLMASLLAILPPFTRAQAQSCPLTPTEINSALGLDLDAGQAQKPLIFAGDQMLICDYPGKANPSFMLKQTVMGDVNNPYNAKYLKMMAGGLTPVPGDPDGALWKLDLGQYLRNRKCCAGVFKSFGTIDWREGRDCSRNESSSNCA